MPGFASKRDGLQTGLPTPPCSRAPRSHRAVLERQV